MKIEVTKSVKETIDVETPSYWIEPIIISTKKGRKYHSYRCHKLTGGDKNVQIDILINVSYTIQYGHFGTHNFKNYIQITKEEFEHHFNLVARLLRRIYNSEK